MCGLFALFGIRKAAELTVIGLHGLQHRAIDYAGIVSSDGNYLYRESGPGLARQVFTKEMLDRLHGKSALGHIRYPTVADDPTRDNTQPIMGHYRGVPFALAHNGNLTNVEELRKLLPNVPFLTSSDSEYILRLLERGTTGNLEEDLARVLKQLRGSFALVLIFPDRLIAVRDPQGNRPLSLGTINGGGLCLSSETCMFPNLDVRHVADIEPGTLVSITKDGVSASVRFAEADERKCRFEGIYFSHPASTVFDENVIRFRMALGAALQEFAPVPGADIVVGIPDSAKAIAMGYAQSKESGEFIEAIFRSHYVGRTFIAATQAMRDSEVAQKFYFADLEIVGKRIVLVDDSIVRGTTIPNLVRKLRARGALEVHVRIGCPPIMHPCRYGINTPTEAELVSAQFSPEELCKRIGADSLAFTPLSVLKELSAPPGSFCYACMDGKYW